MSIHYFVPHELTFTSLFISPQKERCQIAATQADYRGPIQG